MEWYAVILSAQRFHPCRHSRLRCGAQETMFTVTFHLIEHPPSIFNCFTKSTFTQDVLYFVYKLKTRMTLLLFSLLHLLHLLQRSILPGANAPKVILLKNLAQRHNNKRLSII